MSENNMGVTPAIVASDWERDPNAYDPYARQRRFTFNGRALVAQSGRAEQADEWPITVRDAVTRCYIRTVSNWRRMPEELAAHLAG